MTRTEFLREVRARGVQVREATLDNIVGQLPGIERQQNGLRCYTEQAVEKIASMYRNGPRPRGRRPSSKKS